MFPELEQQVDFISKVIKEEEVSFLRTLENGLKIFNDAHSSAAKNVGAAGRRARAQRMESQYPSFDAPL